MARVLIAGCGYVGSAAADLFSRAGWEVEGWTASSASAEKSEAAGFPVRAVDLSDRPAVAKAASRFDAIIQCASTRGGGADAHRRVYLEGARNLQAVFPNPLHIFTSSTSVYAQRDGEWVDEKSPAEPHRETGRILREAEDVVLEGSGVVARLAGIYGPGRSALLEKFLSGKAVLDAQSDRYINQVHRDDIAAALLLLAEKSLEKRNNPSEPNQIYNVSDGNPVSRRECFVWLANHLKRPLPPAEDNPVTRKRGDSNKRVSNEKLRVLGWEPRYPTFASAITESILPGAR